MFRHWLHSPPLRGRRQLARASRPRRRQRRLGPRVRHRTAPQIDDVRRDRGRRRVPLDQQRRRPGARSTPAWRASRARRTSARSSPAARRSTRAPPRASSSPRAAAASSRSRRVPEQDPKNPKKLNAAVQAVFTGILPGSPMLAGVASGGVYKSTDGGATWQPPAPGNGMVALGDRLEPRLVQGQRRDRLRGDAERHLHLDRLRLHLDAVQRRHHGPDAARLGRRQVPEHLLRGHHRRPLPLDQRSASPGTGSASGTTVRAITQFNGIDTKRIYAATDNGVVAVQTDLDPLPGKATWRKLTHRRDRRPTRRSGALNSYINTPGTLLAGTHGGGGYALVLMPPVWTGAKPTRQAAPRRGSRSRSRPRHGTWTGTPTIEFTYQWQDCTVTCADITGRDRRLRSWSRRRAASTASSSPPRTTSRPARCSRRQGERHHRRLRPRAPALAARRRRQHQHRLDQAHAGRPAAARRRPDGAEAGLFNPAATSTHVPVVPLRGRRATARSSRAPPPSTTRSPTRTSASTLCVAVTGTNASGSKTLDCTGLRRTRSLAPNPKQTSAADDRRQRLGRPHAAVRRRHRGRTAARASSVAGSAATPTAGAARRSPTRARPT